MKKVCNKEKEEKEKAEQMNTYLHPNSSYVPYQTQQSGFDSQGRIWNYRIHSQMLVFSLASCFFSNSFRGKLSIMGSHQSDKRNMYLQNPARSQASRMMPASSPHSNPYLTPQNRNMAAQQKWVFNNIDSNNGNKPRWMLIILISSRYMQTPASPAPKWTYLSPKIGRSNILSL